MSKYNPKATQARIDSLTQSLKFLAIEKVVLEKNIAEKRRILAELEEEQQKHLPLTKAMKEQVIALRNGWTLKKSTSHSSHLFYRTHPKGPKVKLRKSVAKGLLARKIVERGTWIVSPTDEYPLTDWGRSADLGIATEEKSVKDKDHA